MITKEKKIVFVLCLFVVLLSSLIGLVFNSTAFAEETNAVYTDVLEDLKKDSNFKPENYPLVADNYSIQLMQFGESENRELFAYVYQPSGNIKNLRGSSINLSTTVNDNISYHNYRLKLLNSNGVFFKYKVENFEVRNEPTRYYAVSSIFRYFDESIDEQADNDNKITEVPFKIARQYCYSILNGKPYCSVVDIETITITDKFVGFVRYKDGFELFPSACDSHFVAFDTDKPIDKLLEADVYYTAQSCVGTVNINAGTSERKDFGTKKDEYAYLKYTDKVEHTGDGWFAGTYKWDRIETVDQFTKENDLTQNVYSGALLDINVASKITEEGITALKSKKWVLCFAETEYEFKSAGYIHTTTTTVVGDVTILRLKFETDGITYNLGTIDNKQTGSDKPSNEEETDIGIAEWLKKLGQFILLMLAIILLVLLLIVLWPVIKLIIQAIVWLICLPFKAIGAVFKSFKKNADNKALITNSEKQKKTKSTQMSDKQISTKQRQSNKKYYSDERMKKGK